MVNSSLLERSSKSKKIEIAKINKAEKTGMIKNPAPPK